MANIIILHCILKSDWENLMHNTFFGHNQIASCGFIHCSDIEYFWRVAPCFADENADLLLLCIDTDKVSAEIKWEDGDNCSREYPHIYGLVETAAVIQVLPFYKSNSGEWLKNNDFIGIENK